MPSKPKTNEWERVHGRINAPRLTKKQLDSLSLQPWFLSRSAYHTIAQLVPRAYLLKMRDYYDRYGCMRCNSRTNLYGSNAMCEKCVKEVARRVRRCWKKRQKLLQESSRNHEIKETIFNAKTAHELLRDLISHNSSKKHHHVEPDNLTEGDQIVAPGQRMRPWKSGRKV
jgi:hypothetical protein